MGLSNDLISQFVKATNDNAKTKKETTTVYGTVREVNGQKQVQLDGSDITTPVSTTVDVKEGDRVIVMLKNHTATITGNLQNPASRSNVYIPPKDPDGEGVITNAEEMASKITELEIAVADRITTEQLNTESARITDELVAKDVKIQNELNASIVEVEKKLTAKDVEIEGKLTAQEGRFTEIETNKLGVEEANAAFLAVDKKFEATNAEVNNLKATYADFEKATTDELEAKQASIDELDTKKLDAESVKTVCATIDFSNIGVAAIEEFFSKSGMIDNLTVGEGTVTGFLVGVTIKGDLIEGGTVVADKLVIQGEDGLYYKLNTDGVSTEAEQTEYNSLDGSVIAAKSITATKISVDDLVAFGATIGGFNITLDSLYSGVKESIDSTTQGVYLDKIGQISIGDADNYLRYYKDEAGNWKLEISAESILFGNERKSSASDIKALTEHVKIGTYTDPETNETQPCVELSEGDSDFKQVITNTATMFKDGDMVRTKIDTEGVETENLKVKDEFRQGGFMWKARTNGNLGLTWKGGNG